MLRGRVSDDGDVAVLEGDREGFRALAALIRSGPGRFPLVTIGDPRPYGRWLSSIAVATTTSDHVDVQYSSDDDELRLAYAATRADNLAEILGDSMADDDVAGSHRHFEFHSGHPFLAESALPLVLERVGD